MAAFTRTQQRYACAGVCLNAPVDQCPPGKYPILQNIRSYQAESVQARLGLSLLANGNFGVGVVHSLGRLNDSTAFAASAFWLVFGAGTTLRGGNSTYPQIDTGYSGNPLGMQVATPPSAPNPWMYVTDSSRMRKIDVNNHVYPIGIAQPPTAPALTLDPLYRAILANFTGVFLPWIAAGAAASGITPILRVNTTISNIIYDSGSTGNVSVVPASMASIDSGTLIVFNGVETEQVQQVLLAVASTTIAGIIYDAGTSGLCTIQPAASLGTGQLEMPTMEDYAARAGAYGNLRDVSNPNTTPVPDMTGDSARIRQVDFPVNCLVTLGGATETVRILSVALGPDGIQSFRCSTASTHAAGDSITGVASFRTSTSGTYTNGQTLQAGGIQNTITPGGSPSAATGGVQTGAPWSPTENISQINGIAVMPDDDFHLAVRISDCTVVDAVRIYLDVDAATNDFTQNYFFFEWRANDIIAAIQAANVDPTATLQSVRSTTVSNTVLNTGTVVGVAAPNGVGIPTADQAVTSALAIGNNQWIELHCKIRDLVRVGTDPSRSWNNIAAAEILVAMTGANPITVGYHSIFITGGRGPDVGLTGPPYVTCYRYRSSLTGAISNPSPATRAGVICRRQGMTSAATQSGDAQCDLIDYFRFGGALTEWTYAGTGPNSATPSFDDTFSDPSIEGGPALEYTRFQPFAIPDLPRTGTCKVVGSAIQRLSGASFNTAWAPGTPIVVNGRTYTLYSQPPSTSLLFINENAGNIASTNFSVTAPTLLSQNLPAFWGDVQGVYFACGDPNNPGALYWTWPYDPDRHSDANVLYVNAGSDPLQNGWVWDGTAFVATSNDIYVIAYNPGSQAPVQAFKTPCGKGFWTRWAFCWTPKGTVFLAEDGIYLTVGGTTAQSLTDADLYPLFPHDGAPGVAVNGYNPVDMTQTTSLRLSYINGYVYFDYVDTGAVARTLAMRLADFAWFPDVSSPGVQARYSATGSGVYQELIGGRDGSVYTPAGVVDASNAPIAARIVRVDDQGDFRRQKIYRDNMIDGILTAASVFVSLTVNDLNTLVATNGIGGTTGRAQYNTGILPSTGTYGRNLGIDLQWNATAVGIPQLFGWDVAYQLEPELSSSWLSGPTTFGLTGYIQLAGIYFAFRSSVDMILTVIIDGVTYSYNIGNSGGLYAKTFFWLQAVKGLTFQLGAQCVNGSSFQVYDQDIEVLAQDWGQSGYKRIRAF